METDGSSEALDRAKVIDILCVEVDPYNIFK